MIYSRDFLDLLRSRTSLVHTVSRTVKLVRKGSDNWLGLCPFHNEKTPSFSISEQKGMYYCHGCQAKGDVFTFLAQRHSMSFSEAVQSLAHETGIALPEHPQTPHRKWTEQQTSRLRMACARADVWYHSRLKEDGRADIARRYLKERAFGQETCERFSIGYAPPGGEAFLQFMQDKGFSVQELIRAGLAIQKAVGGRKVLYTYFRNRLMFPIHDRQGRAIAFGGRTLSASVGSPKYVNSPETPIFRKRETLYNLHRASASASAKNEILVVEGYTDVCTLGKFDFSHVVAPLGTSIGEAHLRALWRLADEPVLCLDGDPAGRKAARRTAERTLPLLSAGKSLRFVFLPGKEDPDSFVRKNGAQALERHIADAWSLVRTLWQLCLQDRTPRTPEQRAALRKTLRGYAQSIPDREIAADYQACFDAWTSNLQPASFAGSRPFVRSGWRKPIPPGQEARLVHKIPASPNPEKARELRAGILFAAAIQYPRVLAPVVEEIAHSVWRGSEKLQGEIIERLADVHSTTSPARTSQSLQAILHRGGLSKSLAQAVCKHAGFLLEADVSDARVLSCVREILRTLRTSS